MDGTFTLGEVAGLIAALAFVVLVVMAVRVLLKLANTFGALNESIEVLTKDADAISGEVEQLLNKTNTLMDDINSKSKKVDPLFETVAELSESVSDLNQASRQMADKISDSAQAVGNVTKFSSGIAVARGIWKFYKNKQAD